MRILLGGGKDYNMETNKLQCFVYFKLNIKYVSKRSLICSRPSNIIAKLYFGKGFKCNICLTCILHVGWQKPYLF